MLPRTPSLSLSGRTALVTGASRGIGLGAAMALAEAGATVTMAARGETELMASVGAMQAEGLAAEGRVLDICDDASLEECLATPFNIIVNSAGLARHGPALDTKMPDYDAVMAINLRAAYRLSQLGAQAMHKAERGGVILHISSQMGHVGGLDRAVYCASKHGLEGMIKAMAIEFGPMGIRINSICPTFIRTPLTESTFADAEKRAWIESNIKLNRVGVVEDIMGAVRFLASDAAAMITGTSLLVDGGWTAS